MCGIVGYVGQRPACEIVVDALRRMEYRGYDSAGVALLDGSGGLIVSRKAGRVANLEAALDEAGINGSSGATGLGHTRWATHGRPTDRNAHPHRDATGKVAVVHNGIIENYAALRHELELAGVEFASDTDTEVSVHLVAREFAHGRHAGDFAASVLAVLRRLEGHFTLVFAHADEPGTIVAARRSTPLVLGVGDGEMFVGSDVAAFIEHTREAVELGQDQAVVVTAGGYRITDFDGNPAVADVDYRRFHIDWDTSAAEKGGYEYFMLKEIAEQPDAVSDTLLGHFVDNRIVLDEQRLSDQELRDIDKVFVVACGTAYHSGMLAKYAIEHWCRIPVEVELSSEFRYRDPILDYSTLVVAISQSGETADTLQAIRHARLQRSKVLAICGDAGFLMNVQDLETAVRLGINAVFMVWEDGEYGLIKWKQQNQFNGKHSDLGFTNPDWELLAKAFGMWGREVKKASDLKPTLKEAFEQNGPALIAVKVDYGENMKLTKRLGEIEVSI